MNEMARQKVIPAQEEAKSIVIHDRQYEQILDDGRVDGIFREALACGYGMTGPIPSARLRRSSFKENDSRTEYEAHERL